MAESSSPAMRRGYVKSVLSGDAIVLQGQAAGGPPPEFTVYLSSVSAPRLGRRPTESSAGTTDEPFAWDAREFLRKKIVGNVVTFIRDFTATSGRDHGRIYLGGTNVDNAENVTKSAVSEGLLEVRAGKIADEYTTELLELQEQAKSAGKGKWGDATNAVREVKWVIDNPRDLVDKYKQKPVDAVVEMVRDGSTLRVMLLPSFEYVTVQLSGVRAPACRAGADGKPEPFSEEARFFVEQRLLQRDVQVVIESVSNQNVVGTILHPNGDIAVPLVKEGYAKCVDWSIGLCTNGAEPLRAAEKLAKEKKMRLWRDYKPASTGAYTGEKKNFTAKVIEVVMSDALIVQKDNGEELKIYLSSVRLPRDQGEEHKPAVGRQFRPLYDVPFMFEAREFLRKRLVGKKAQITVDYVQPKSDQFPEKTCCTVVIGGLNMAEQLVSKGISKVVRHRNDDENRSSCFDALLAAEAKAEKSQKGLFAEKSADKHSTLRIQELAGDAARSKQFLPYLQRSSRPEAVVEFVGSGSRLRLYVPKETCIITFLLGGINCPKSARFGAGGVKLAEGEPLSEEALKFTRAACLQREVEIEVEGIDKQGNFIGYLFVSQVEGGKPQNLSVELVELGLASVHFSAEKSGHVNQLQSAEQRAKAAKKGIWANYNDNEEQEAAAEEAANMASERTVNYKKVAITDVQKGNLRFAAQLVDDGAKLEKMTSELRTQLNENPPLAGSYTPKRGDVVAAKFSADGQWYRAKVESIRAGQAELLYIDYGNRESVAASSLAPLPAGMASISAGAKEYQLALCQIPNDKDYADASDYALQNILFSAATAELNVEYKAGGVEYAQVLIDKQDVGRQMVADGFALAEKRREQRLQTMVADYAEAEKVARRERRNIWEYGDFTGSEM